MVSHFSVSVSPQIVVSAQPLLVGFLRARNDGVRSVLNLRCDDEWDLPLSPAQESAKVNEFELQYRHFPVPRGAADKAQVERFGRELGRMTTPALVHCGSGERAMALVLLTLGASRGWTASPIFERAEELGCPITNEKLRALVEECLPDPEEDEGDTGPQDPAEPRIG